MVTLAPLVLVVQPKGAFTFGLVGAARTSPGRAGSWVRLTQGELSTPATPVPVGRLELPCLPVGLRLLHG